MFININVSWQCLQIKTFRSDIIHLLPSLEGDMKICPTQKIHVARGRSPRETWIFGWDKSSCLLTNWATNCLLYRKLKHDVIQRRALCRETRQGNTTSGGKHDDLFSLHVTSLDQSYFFIRHINYMRYNNIFYQSFPKCFVHFWMIFCKNVKRISCQIVFVNTYWPQSWTSPFKSKQLYILEFKRSQSLLRIHDFDLYEERISF